MDKQYKKGKDIIVLMHDTNSKTNTVKMLPDAIDYIQSLGYTFETLEHQAHELKPDAKEFPLRLVRGRFFCAQNQKEERTAVNFQEEE